MAAHSPYDGSMLCLTNTINLGVTSTSRCSQRPEPVLHSTCSHVKSGLARHGTWTGQLVLIHWEMLFVTCVRRQAFLAIIPIIPSDPQGPLSCTIMVMISNLSWRSPAIGPLPSDHTKGPQTSRESWPAIASSERSASRCTPLDNHLAPVSHHWGVLGQNIYNYLIASVLDFSCIVVFCIVPRCIVNTAHLNALIVGSVLNVYQKLLSSK